jgi:hypothetical protein
MLSSLIILAMFEQEALVVICSVKTEIILARNAEKRPKWSCKKVPERIDTDLEL